MRKKCIPHLVWCPFVIYDPQKVLERASGML